MHELFLVGHRVGLRLFDPAAEGNALLRWWNLAGGAAPSTQPARPVTALAELPGLDPRSALAFTIVVLEGHHPVGLASLEDLDPFQRRARLFALVEPEWQRRRLAQEACELLLRHGFERLGLELVSASFDEGHEAARRLALRLSFEQVAVLPNWNLRDGRRTNELVYALTRVHLEQVRKGKQNLWSN